MALDLDSTEWETTEDLQGGGNRPSPGIYHVVVQKCEECESSQKHTPGLQVEVVVLSGTVPGQEGKTISKFMSARGSDADKTKTCQKALFTLARACGLMQFGERRSVDFSACEGRECIVAVEAKDYINKAGAKTPGSELNTFSWLALGDAEAKDVPRDTTSPGMQRLAQAIAGNGGQQQVAATATAAPSDDYDV